MSIDSAGPPAPRVRLGLRLALALFYFGAGVLHLPQGAPFALIVPPWVPAPRLVVAVTGVCELLGATGLMIPISRRLAGAMLALYAVCVFPANLHHALDHVHVG